MKVPDVDFSSFFPATDQEDEHPLQELAEVFAASGRHGMLYLDSPEGGIFYLMTGDDPAGLDDEFLFYLEHLLDLKVIGAPDVGTVYFFEQGRVPLECTEKDNPPPTPLAFFKRLEKEPLEEDGYLLFYPDDAAYPYGGRLSEEPDEAYGMVLAFYAFLMDNGFLPHERGKLYHLPPEVPFPGEEVRFGIDPRSIN